MEPSPGPILCAHLMRKVDDELLELLRALYPAEWNLQTVAPLWKVRDVAAHLLDTALRKLSMARDGYFAETVQIKSNNDLVELVNRLNREGVALYRRLSPSVLIDLMQIACGQNAAYHESLDPYAPAGFGVSWAGEEQSLNWFDTARELTERWHHQQQIRLATNRPGIMTRELYHPVLDCFLRALPFTYRAVEAPVGTVLDFTIAGDCGGTWKLLREEAAWSLVNDSSNPAASHVTIPQEIAWRVFTKGISREQAQTLTTFEGNTNLGAHILATVAIIG